MQILTIASLLVSTLATATATATTVNISIAIFNETFALPFAATCLAPEYHIDFPGQDFANAPAATHEQCCALCYGLRDCGAYTWTSYNGGTCWFKGSRSRGDWKGANADGSAHTISVEINRCGKPVTPDQDLEGVDGGSMPGAHAESCCHACANYRGCRGFSWTTYNGGTCWFKGGTIRTVAKPGVYSWYY